MPITRRYSIRIVLHDDQLDNRDLMCFIESLRYNGTLHVLKVRYSDPDRVIEIRVPENISNSMSRSWAETKAERMQSFGFNAVCAPVWDGKTDL